MKKNQIRKKFMRITALLLGIVFVIQNDGVAAWAATVEQQMINEDSELNEDDTLNSSTVTEARGIKDDPIPLRVNTTVNIDIPSGGLWYSYTPTVSGKYTISSSSDDYQDTYVELYNDAFEKIIDSNYGGPGSGNFRLDYNLTDGTTYYYLVRMYNFNDTVSVDLIFESDAIDQDYSPVIVDVPTDAPYVPTEEPIVTPDPIIPESAALTSDSQIDVTVADASQSVWYSYTPKESADYIISTADDCDTAVSLYCDTFDEPLASDDNNAIDENFRLKYRLLAGKTYYYEITTGVSGDSFKLNFYNSDKVRAVSEIKLKNEPTVKDYYICKTQKVSYNGIAIEVTYDDGVIESVAYGNLSCVTGNSISITCDTLYNPDKVLQTGSHNLNISYMNKSVQAEINVYEGVANYTNITTDESKSMFSNLEANAKWYKYTPEESGIYNISSINQINSYVEVYDGNGNKFNIPTVESNYSKDSIQYSSKLLYAYLNGGQNYYIKNYSYYKGNAYVLTIKKADIKLTESKPYNQDVNENKSAYIVVDIEKAGSYTISNKRKYSNEQYSSYNYIYLYNRKNGEKTNYDSNLQSDSDDKSSCSCKWNINFTQPGEYILEIPNASGALESIYTITRDVSNSLELNKSDSYTTTGANEIYSFTAPEAGYYYFDGKLYDYNIGMTVNAENVVTYSESNGFNIYKRKLAQIYLDKDECCSINISSDEADQEYVIYTGKVAEFGQLENNICTNNDAVHSFSVETTGEYVIKMNRSTADQYGNYEWNAFNNIYALSDSHNNLNEVHSYIYGGCVYDSSANKYDYFSLRSVYLEKGKEYVCVDTSFNKENDDYTIDIIPATELAVGNEVWIDDIKGESRCCYTPSEDGYYSVNVTSQSYPNCTMMSDDYSEITSLGGVTNATQSENYCAKSTYHLLAGKKYKFRLTGCSNASVSVNKLPDIDRIEIASPPDKTVYTRGYDDYISYTGLVVDIIQTDGTRTSCMYDDFPDSCYSMGIRVDNLETDIDGMHYIGKQGVKVTVGEVTTTLDIEIKPFDCSVVENNVEALDTPVSATRISNNHFYWKYTPIKTGPYSFKCEYNDANKVNYDNFAILDTEGRSIECYSLECNNWAILEKGKEYYILLDDKSYDSGNDTIKLTISVPEEMTCDETKQFSTAEYSMNLFIPEADDFYSFDYTGVNASDNNFGLRYDGIKSIDKNVYCQSFAHQDGNNYIISSCAYLKKDVKYLIYSYNYCNEDMEMSLKIKPSKIIADKVAGMSEQVTDELCNSAQYYKLTTPEGAEGTYDVKLYTDILNEYGIDIYNSDGEYLYGRCNQAESDSEGYGYLCTKEFTFEAGTTYYICLRNIGNGICRSMLSFSKKDYTLICTDSNSYAYRSSERESDLYYKPEKDGYYEIKSVTSGSQLYLQNIYGMNNVDNVIYRTSDVQYLNGENVFFYKIYAYLKAGKIYRINCNNDYAFNVLSTIYVTSMKTIDAFNTDYTGTASIGRKYYKLTVPEGKSGIYEVRADVAEAAGSYETIKIMDSEHNLVNSESQQSGYDDGSTYYYHCNNVVYLKEGCSYYIETACEFNATVNDSISVNTTSETSQITMNNGLGSLVGKVSRGFKYISFDIPEGEGGNYSISSQIQANECNEHESLNIYSDDGAMVNGLKMYNDASEGEYCNRCTFDTYLDGNKTYYIVVKGDAEATGSYSDLVRIQRTSLKESAGYECINFVSSRNEQQFRFTPNQTGHYYVALKENYNEASNINLDVCNSDGSIKSKSVKYCRKISDTEMDYYYSSDVYLTQGTEYTIKCNSGGIDENCFLYFQRQVISEENVEDLPVEHDKLLLPHSGYAFSASNDGMYTFKTKCSESYAPISHIRDSQLSDISFSEHRYKDSSYYYETTVYLKSGEEYCIDVHSIYNCEISVDKLEVSGELTDGTVTGKVNNKVRWFTANIDENAEGYYILNCDVVSTSGAFDYIYVSDGNGNAVSVNPEYSRKDESGFYYHTKTAVHLEGGCNYNILVYNPSVEAEDDRISMKAVIKPVTIEYEENTMNTEDYYDRCSYNADYSGARLKISYNDGSIESLDYGKTSPVTGYTFKITDNISKNNGAFCEGKYKAVFTYMGITTSTVINVKPYSELPETDITRGLIGTVNSHDNLYKLIPESSGYYNLEYALASAEGISPNEAYIYDSSMNRMNSSYNNSFNNKIDNDGKYEYYQCHRYYLEEGNSYYIRVTGLTGAVGTYRMKLRQDKSILSGMNFSSVNEGVGFYRFVPGEDGEYTFTAASLFDSTNENYQYYYNNYPELKIIDDNGNDCTDYGNNDECKIGDKVKYTRMVKQYLRAGATYYLYVTNRYGAYYGKVSSDIRVDETKTIESITINKYPRKEYCRELGESFSMDGLELNVNYSNNTNDTVTYFSNNNFFDFDFGDESLYDTDFKLVSGEHKITVSYKGKSTDFNIIVKNAADYEMLVFDESNTAVRTDEFSGNQRDYRYDTFTAPTTGFYNVGIVSNVGNYSQIAVIKNITSGKNLVINPTINYVNAKYCTNAAVYLEKDSIYCIKYYNNYSTDYELSVKPDTSKVIEPLSKVNNKSVNIKNYNDTAWYSFTPDTAGLFHMVVKSENGGNYNFPSINLYNYPGEERITSQTAEWYENNTASYSRLDYQLEAGKTYYYCITKNNYSSNNSITMSFGGDLTPVSIDTVGGEQIYATSLNTIDNSFKNLEFDIKYADDSHETVKYGAISLMNKSVISNHGIVIEREEDGRLKDGIYTIRFTYGNVFVEKDVKVLPLSSLNELSDATITLNAGEEQWYLYTPETDGYYSVSFNSELGNVYSDIFDSYMNPIKKYSSDSNYNSGNYNTNSLYYLTGGTQYVVKLHSGIGSGSQSVQCAIKKLEIPESISIETYPQKNYFNSVDNDFNVAGLSIKVNYAEGSESKDEIIEYDKKSVNSGLKFVAGVTGIGSTRNVQISYLGKTTSFNITFSDVSENAILSEGVLYTENMTNTYGAGYYSDKYEYGYTYFVPENSGYYNVEVSSDGSNYAYIDSIKDQFAEYVSQSRFHHTTNGDGTYKSAVVYLTAAKTYYFKCGVKDSSMNQLTGNYGIKITSIADATKNRITASFNEESTYADYQYIASEDGYYVFDVASEGIMDFNLYEGDGDRLTAYYGTDEYGESRSYCYKLHGGSRYYISCANGNIATNEYTISVSKKKEIKEIKIETLPDKTAYYQNVDEDIDYTGLSIRVIYNDDTSEVIKYGEKSSWNISISAICSNLVLGNNYVECTYLDKELQFMVTMERFSANSLENIEDGMWIDAKSKYPGRSSYYKFTPYFEDDTTEHMFHFYSRGEADTTGYIYDSSMNRIAMDMDGGTGNNFSIDCNLKSGTTYIIRTKADSMDAYQFRLTDTALGNGIVGAKADKDVVLMKSVGSTESVNVLFSGYDEDQSITNRAYTYSLSESDIVSVSAVNGSDGSGTAENIKNNDEETGTAKAVFNVTAIKSGSTVLTVKSEDGDYEVSIKLVVDINAPLIQSVYPADNTTFGKNSHSVSVYAQDDYSVDMIRFGYSTTGSDYTYIDKKINDLLGSKIVYASSEIPLNDFANSDIIYVDVYAVDKLGNESEHIKKQYVYDKEAPLVSITNAVQTGQGTAELNYSCSTADTVSFSIYRKVSTEADSSYVYIGSQYYQSDKTTYKFIDASLLNASSNYTYKVTTADKCGNTADAVENVTIQRYNEKPVVNMVIKEDGKDVKSKNVLKAGTEYSFEFKGSTDDVEISECTVDFDDGSEGFSTDNVDSAVVKKTFSFEEEEQTSKKLSLTVTLKDNENAVTTETYNITLIDPEAAAYLKVHVVDEDGYPLIGAPVYHNFGEENQTIEYTNQDGYVEYFDLPGMYTIGAYASGYMPVSKNIQLNQGDINEETLTLCEGSVVDGKLETHKMTYDEIVDAGIDLEDEENYHIIKYEVTLEYEKVLFYYNEDTGNYLNDGYTSGGGGGCGYCIKNVSKDLTVVLKIPVKVSILKEFYDVDLFIFNNADTGFSLKNNNVNLNIEPDDPESVDGLSLVKTDNSCNSLSQTIDEIPAHSTKTLRWILRGDKSGTYKISADYSGNMVFGSQVIDTYNTTFESDDDIKVYGVDNLRITMQVPRLIPVKAGEKPVFYYNLIMKNVGTSDEEDMFLPGLDGGGNLLLTRYFSTEGTSDIKEMPITLKAQEKILKMYEITDQFEEQLEKFGDYDSFLLGFKDSFVKELTKYGVQLDVVTCEWEDLLECRDSLKAEVPTVTSENAVGADYGYTNGDAYISVNAAVSDSALKIYDQGKVDTTPKEDAGYKLSYIWYDTNMNVVQAESSADGANRYVIPEGLVPGTYSYHYIVRATRYDNHESAQTQYGRIDVTIDKKEVGLEWSGYDNLVYDGEFKNVSAKVTDLVGKDVCTAVITSGDEVDAGNHTATIVSLSNPYYRLPANTSKQYTIAPRNAKLEWSGYETRTYNGIESKVTATLTNLIANDECEVMVSDGAHAAAGTHAALAVDLSNYNYVLSKDELISREYDIKKAELIAKYIDETTYYNTSPKFNVSIDGYVNGETEAALTASGALILPTVSCDIPMEPGVYNLEPVGGGADNYYFEYQSGELNIERRNALQDVQYTVDGKLQAAGWNSDKIKITPCEGYRIAEVNSLESAIPDENVFTDSSIIKSNETANGTIYFYIINENTSEIFNCSIVDYKIDKTKPVIKDIEKSNADNGIRKMYFTMYDELSAISDFKAGITSATDKQDVQLCNSDRGTENEYYIVVDSAGTYSLTATDYAGNTNEVTKLATTYVVNFDSKGGSECSDRVFMKGEVLDNLPIPLRTGYVFKGWYNENDEQITSESVINKDCDIKLHALWEAIPAKAPVVTGIASSSLYGDEISVIKVNAIAADDTEYILSYNWYRRVDMDNYELIDITVSGECVVNNPDSAGEHIYYCKVTATRKDNGEEISTDYVSTVLNVAKRTIAIKWENTDNLIYTGAVQCVSASALNLVGEDECTLTVENNEVIAAGDYTAVVKGLDNENYKLPDDLTKPFKILKAVLTAVYDGDNSAYYGTRPSVSVDVSGFVNNENETSADGYEKPEIKNVPSTVGEHLITPTGGNADNYRFSYVSGKLNISRRDAIEGVNGQYIITGDSNNDKYILPFAITPNKGYWAGYSETETSIDKLNITDKSHDGFYIVNEQTGEIYNKIMLGNIIYIEPTDTPEPTKAPTQAPTSEPTSEPTKVPVTQAPTSEPTKVPVTQAPTSEPTSEPTKVPVTQAPTSEPTKVSVTQAPTHGPVVVPTQVPVYKITYVLNGGTNALDNPVRYKITDQAIDLKDAGRKKYIFTGWYTDAEHKNMVNKISAGITGNITLYAGWAKCKPKVAINSMRRIGKNIVIKFKRNDKNSGYKIIYSTSRKFKASKTRVKETNNIAKFTIKKVSGKRYYFKIKAFQIDSLNKRIYSEEQTKSLK